MLTRVGVVAAEDPAARLGGGPGIGVEGPGDFHKIDAETDVGNIWSLSGARTLTRRERLAALFQVFQLLGRGVGFRLEKRRRVLRRWRRLFGRIQRAVAGRKALIEAQGGNGHPVLASFHVQFDGAIFTFERCCGRGCFVKHRSDLLPIDPNRHLKRVGRAGPVALRVDPEHIVAGGREAVRGMKRAGQRESGYVIIRQGKGQGFGKPAVVTAIGADSVGRLVPDHGRLHGTGAEHGRVDHFFGCGEIFFHQDRGEREGITDHVEAIPGIVLRKIVGGPEVNAEQVANGVVVLGTVEAARRHAPRFGFDRRLRAVQFHADPVGGCLQVSSFGPGRATGRHFSGHQTPLDGFPLVPIFPNSGRRGESLQVQVSGLHGVVVTGKAVLHEQWLHGLLIHGGTLRQRRGSQGYSEESSQRKGRDTRASHDRYKVADGRRHGTSTSAGPVSSELRTGTSLRAGRFGVRMQDPWS